MHRHERETGQELKWNKTISDCKSWNPWKLEPGKRSRKRDQVTITSILMLLTMCKIEQCLPNHVMGLVRTGLGIPENGACGTLWTVGLPGMTFLMPLICHLRPRSRSWCIGGTWGSPSCFGLSAWDDLGAVVAAPMDSGIFHHAVETEIRDVGPFVVVVWSTYSGIDLHALVAPPMHPSSWNHGL
jgi:hypothetical protein